MTDIDQAEVQKKLDIRERARKDKLFLATEILGYDFVESVHRELFDLLIPYDPKKAWREQSDIHDRLILWPRGHFKTTAIIVEIIQAIINWPNIRILLMQGSVSTTQNLLSEIKAHFLGTAPRSKFKDVFPEHCAITTDKEGNAVPPSRLGTVNKFTTPARTQGQLRESTITVASPKAITTGMHFDLGVFDDLVNALNSQSHKQLEKTAKEFYSMVPLIDPGGYRIVTGTRYAHEDLYLRIIRGNTNNQWTVSVKTCFTDDGKGVRFPQTKLEDGRVVGFTFEQLLAYQKEDPATFASQYLNRPASSANQLFTEQQILSAVVAEQSSPVLSQAVLFVDLASSQAENADDSVIITGKVDQLSNVYIVDGIGDRWTPSQLAAQVIQAALKHRPLRIMIENTPSAKYFVAYLQTLCQHQGLTLPLDYIKVNSTKDAKYTRIAALDGNLRTKRLRFFPGLSCWEKLLEQFVRFPGSHDDYIDTVALAVQAFGGQLGAVTPQTSSKHPMLQRIEMQERYNEQHGFIAPQEPFQENSMGSDFE